MPNNTLIYVSSTPLSEQTLQTNTPTNEMKKKVVVGFILICLLSFGDLMVSAETELPPSEVEALKAIASKLKISSDVWNVSINPCKWLSVPPPVKRTTTVTHNLTCERDPTTGLRHVVLIELKSMNLTGELPEEFANLTHLKTLDLTRNVLHGSIPAAWASLPLVKLILLGNRISGAIPDEIGNIKTLEYLSLENNLLEGSIPPSLGGLTNLRRLLLSANNFIGELPKSLGNLTNLTDFRIDGNGISGQIPSFIGSWTLLKRLDMQGTSLEGPFPPNFSNLNLTQLRVTDFKGDGAFPPLERMKSLKYLFLRNCSISDRLPNYIGKISDMDGIDLSFNNFVGEIPETFRNLMQGISYMYLAHNMLNGTIPEWIFGTKKIDLSYNSFSGPNTINSCQERDVNLVSSLSSSLDKSIQPCLRRSFPCTKEATNYQLFINCGGKRIKVNGNDYEEDTYSGGATIFYFSGEQNWAYSSTGVFVGNGNAKDVVANSSALNIANPKLYLTARIAASSLKYYGLCLQKGNYTVNLHFAEIIFTDDQTFSSLGRRFFDVFIQGQKVLENFNIAEAAKGASREIVKSFNASVDSSLEIHLRWSGKGTTAIPDRGVYGPLISAISVTPNFEPAIDKGFPVVAIVGIVIASCIVIFLGILSLWFLIHKKETEIEELKQLKLQGTYFTLRQIKIATKNFSPENKIGEGGFGAVYKGVLPDGTMVAVKQLSSKSNQGNREFVNEMGTMSALSHPNLAKLFGCCVEGNRLLLIYEYMENNSLARALFGPEETKLKLDWQTRCKISLHIARGLAFLHEESRLKIVHRDIKATNVLLGKDLNAKISDFGLAKLDDDDGKTHISTRIAGTIGYMAPEYATHGRLTEKADVYSFGVVMLEIVSGKYNANYKCRDDDTINLVDWAHVLQERGRLLEIVDSSLGSDYSKTEAEQMLNLTVACTNLSPALRPTMTSVVMMLEGGLPVPTRETRPLRSMDVSMRLQFSKYSHDSQQTSEICHDSPMNYGGYGHVNTAESLTSGR